MSNYRSGADFERKVIAYLTENGYWCIRAAQSKGIADIVAIKTGQVLLINCKTKSIPPPRERHALASLASRTGCLPIVAQRGSRGSGGRPLLRRITDDGVSPKALEVFIVDELAATTKETP